MSFMAITRKCVQVSTPDHLETKKFPAWAGSVWRKDATRPSVSRSNTRKSSLECAAPTERDIPTRGLSRWRTALARVDHGNTVQDGILEITEFASWTVFLIGQSRDTGEDVGDGRLKAFVQSLVMEQVAVVGSEGLEGRQGFVKVRHPLIMQTFVRVSNG
jgi:hypothetical protein